MAKAKKMTAPKEKGPSGPGMGFTMEEAKPGPKLAAVKEKAGRPQAATKGIKSTDDLRKLYNKKFGKK